MTLLSLSLLGPFRATLAGEPVTGFESNKVRALLAYLAVEADRPHSRSTLAGLLWPELPDRVALTNLRHVLPNLRRAIGDFDGQPSFLLITRQTVQFNTTSDYWLDVTAFSRGIEAVDRAGLSAIDQLAEAIALYQGSFLDGFSLRNNTAFEEWAYLTQARLHHQASTGLQRLTDYYDEQGDYALACRYARRHLELEPWQEQAHRQLMRLLALSGQRAAALAQYETCRQQLADELGVEPAAETAALYTRIRDEALIASESTKQVSSDTSALSIKGHRTFGAATHFVNRERELLELTKYLQSALTGKSRVVFVTGEAGSGKTSLIQEFARRAQQAHSNLVVAGGNCNAYTGVGDPYLPFCEIFGLLTGDIEGRWAAGLLTGENIRRLENLVAHTVQALMAEGPDLIESFLSGTALLDRATAYLSRRDSWLGQLRVLVARKQANPTTANSQQSALVEQATCVLQAVARKQPLLLVFDDLQWADLGSVSLLFHLGRRGADSPLLVVGAYRPEEVGWIRRGERHPLASVVNELQLIYGNTTLALGEGNDQIFVNALLDSEPNRFDDTFREKLFHISRGHPLFTVELLRHMRARNNLVQDTVGRWFESPNMDWTVLPPRVEAVIGERLSRLPPPLQEVLKVASVEGESFTAEVVARIQGLEVHTTIRQLSGVLDKQHQLVRSLGSERVGQRRLSLYQFRHILFQKYLYYNLTEAEHAYLHELVGIELERLYGEQTETVASQLAHHFEAAGIMEKAVKYLHQAGDRAVRLAASEVAISQYIKALALFDNLTDTPERMRQELNLQLALSIPLMFSRGIGSPQVSQVHARTQILCQQLLEITPDLPELFPTLRFLWNYSLGQADYDTAKQWAQQALDCAQRTRSSFYLALARDMLGTALLFLGEFRTSLAYMEQVVNMRFSQEHGTAALAYIHHPILLSQSYSAWMLCWLGYPDQALTNSHQAITWARELDQPFNLVHALAVAGAAVHLVRKEWHTAQVYAEEAITLSTEQSFPHWLAACTILHGRSLVEQGQLERGTSQLKRGLSDYEATFAGRQIIASESAGRSLRKTWQP